MSFLPDGCRESTPAVWVNDVMAISRCPCSFTTWASSTIDPFTPEFDAITKMSEADTLARS